MKPLEKIALLSCVFLVFVPFVSSSAELSIEDRCRVLSDRFVEKSKEPSLPKDYTLIEVESFYSANVDACIHVETKLVGVGVKVFDLSETVITDTAWRHALLLNCDIDGADSVILEKVRALRGRVWNVRYEEYLDDGFGGLPRALKTPEAPYTQSQCKIVLDKWMTVLR